MSGLVVDVLLAISALFVSTALLLEALVCSKGREVVSPSLRGFFLDRQEGAARAGGVVACCLTAAAMQLMLVSWVLTHRATVDEATVLIFAAEVGVSVVLGIGVYLRSSADGRRVEGS